MAKVRAQPAPDDHVAQLFGRDSLYMLMWAVQIIGAAVLTPVTTRVLGLSSFGTVTSANAIMQVLFVFAGLGLQTAVQREYSARANPRGARQLVLAAFVVIVVVSALTWCTTGLWGRALQMTDDLPAAAEFLAALLGLALAPPALLRLSDRAVLIRALSFALPLVPSALSSFVLSTSDRLVIGAALGSEEVARYQVAYNIGSMPMLLLWILHSAWMPRFFAITGEGERRTVLAESRDALYRLLIPILIGFACGAPLVLRVWAPSSYRPDSLLLLLCIVLITAIPSAGQPAATRALTADGRTVAIAVVTILAAVLNVAFDFVRGVHIGTITPRPHPTVTADPRRTSALDHLGVRNIVPGKSLFCLESAAACQTASEPRWYDVCGRIGDRRRSAGTIRIGQQRTSAALEQRPGRTCHRPNARPDPPPQTPTRCGTFP